MAQQSPLVERLITFIEDAFVMEEQIAQTLRRHIEQGVIAPPEVQRRMQQHLAETELQAKRMRQRLEAYDRDPSAIKTTGGQIMGTVMGLMGAVRPDTLARNMRDDYVTEHLEIAAYTLLIATARAAGDEETAKAAEASLREEVVMAEFLSQHLPEALMVSLEQEGIEIPAPSQAQAQRGPHVHISFVQEGHREAKGQAK